MYGLAHFGHFLINASDIASSTACLLSSFKNVAYSVVSYDIKVTHLHSF
jgi:hypothetical protein